MEKCHYPVPGAIPERDLVQHGAKSQQNQRYSCFAKDLPLLHLAPKRWASFINGILVKKRLTTLCDNLNCKIKWSSGNLY